MHIGNDSIHCSLQIGLCLDCIEEIFQSLLDAVKNELDRTVNRISRCSKHKSMTVGMNELVNDDILMA